MTRLKASAAVATLFTLATPALAQSLDPSSGCFYLTGSTLCPGFEGSYVAVNDHISIYPFFSKVYDVQDFDNHGTQYVNNLASTKLDDTLGCNNAQSTTIRYERTVLCGIWTSSSGSLSCIQYYQGPTAVLPKQVCATTCDQNRQSLQDITSNSTICGKSRSSRANQIATDYAACTAGASTATTCVSGDMNEHNCGYANSTSQVCSLCSNSPEKCCAEPSFDISGLCGIDAAALSSAAATSTATAGASKQGSGNKGISGGAIAGIVVGVVCGIALIAALAFYLWRRKRNNNKSNGHLLMSPEEKNQENGWRQTTPESPTQNSPEVRSGPISGAAIEREHSGTNASVGAAATPAVGHPVQTATPTTSDLSASPSVANPTAPGASSNIRGAPSSGPSHGHSGAMAGAAAAGAAVVGAAALAANKQRRDAPSPPVQRNVSPPTPITAPHQSMPQPHSSTTPTAASFPHVPSSPPRPLPSLPTNTSPRSPQSQYPTLQQPASQSRAVAQAPGPKAALATAPQSGAVIAPAPAPAPAPAAAAAAPSNAANMAGVGAGASAAAAASAVAGADTTRLPRLELPQGSGVWIQEGSQVIAQHPYNAALVDELTLVPGMILTVYEIYDDGWARGVVSAGGDPNQIGRVGQFPVVCVTKA